MSSSFSDPFDDSFDDPDESLLVSPTVDRSVSSHQARGSGDGRMCDIGRPLFGQQRLSAERDYNNNNNNDDNKDASPDYSSSTEGADESFLAMDQTPAKSSFNYASAMEELECLAPTPQTDRRGRRGSALFASADASVADEKKVESWPEVRPTASKERHYSASSSLPPRSDDLFEERDPYSPLASPPEHARASTKNVTMATGKPVADSIAAWQGNGASPISASTTTRKGNILASNPFAKYHASSVFRHPCIRKENANESPTLELKVGRPVNESYDEFQLHSNVNTDNTMAKTDDADLSMEVEKDADANNCGEMLDEDDRVDTVDMACVVGANVMSGSESRKQLAEEENLDCSHASTGFLGEKSDANKMTSISTMKQSGEEDELNDTRNSSGSLGESRASDLAGGKSELNDTRDSIGSLGENLDTRIDHREGGNDVNVSVDLAMTAGMVNSRNRRGRRSRRPRFRPPVQDNDGSNSDLSSPLFRNGVVNKSSTAAAAGPWDIDDDDSDEEDTNAKSDYVEKMRESIASYFSNHSDSPPNGSEGDNNDSLESSSSATVVNDAMTSGDVGSPAAHDEGDMSRETQATSYSDEAEDGEGMINLDALGDDASQIDVEETMDYVGHVQSIQYERYESVLAEMNDRTSDSGSAEIDDDAVSRSESLEESLDLAANEDEEEDGDCASGSIVQASFLPNNTNGGEEEEEKTNADPFAEARCSLESDAVEDNIEAESSAEAGCSFESNDTHTTVTARRQSAEDQDSLSCSDKVANSSVESKDVGEAEEEEAKTEPFAEARCSLESDDILERDIEAEQNAEAGCSFESNDTHTTVTARQQSAEDQDSLSCSDNDVANSSVDSKASHGSTISTTQYQKLELKPMGQTDANNQLEEENDSASVGGNCALAAEDDRPPLEDHLTSNRSGELLGTSFEDNISESAAKDTASPTMPSSSPGIVVAETMNDAPDINDVQDTAKAFCDSIIKNSVACMTSNGAPSEASCESEASPQKDLFESSMLNNDVSQPNVLELPPVSTPPTERKSKPSQLSAGAPLLAALPEELSPISKNSSPHNANDLTKNNPQRIQDHEGHNIQTNTGESQMSSSRRSQRRESTLEMIHDDDVGTSDECKKVLGSQIDECLLNPIKSDRSAECSDEETPTSEAKDTHPSASIFQALSLPNHESSGSPSGEDTSSSGAKDTHPTASIFQVLSQPNHESTGSPVEYTSTNESVQEKVETQYLPADVYEMTDGTPSNSLDLAAGKAVPENGVENNDESDFGTSDETFSPPNTSPSNDDIDNTPEQEGKRKSLEDLSSFQKNFNRTSSAFLERLRGAAENRKREVTRGRFSMERKEQILYEQKKVRAETPMAAVDEEVMEEPQRKSVASHQKRKIAGCDPYEPFRARPLPSSTTERPRTSYSVAHATNGSMATNQNNSHVPGRQKKKIEGSDPYKPFKARPMPGTFGSRSSASLGGAKRKSSTAFRPHPAQNMSSVKSSALNVKPPKRLLSGEDASRSIENSRRKRLQEEEAKMRKESTFKARPLPATTSLARKRNFDKEPLVGESLVPAKPARSGKENSSAFVPRSTLRAEERAMYDKEKAEREQTQRQHQIEHRNQIIAQTNSEIKDLKKFIR